MILFLTTFFLIFIAICAKNIRFGVYAVIFLMPLYLWRFSIFGIPTTVLEIMIYILFLTWVSSEIEKNNFYPVLTEGSNGFSRFRKNNSILAIGIALLFLGLILSTLHSSDLRTSLGICKGWFFDPFLFFVVFISVIKEKKQIILSLASWVFSGVAVSIISIFYLLNNDLTFDGRLKAFYISPNYLAMYLAPVFLIILFFLLDSLLFSRRRKSTVTVNANFLLFIIISIPLFFTYSYGAFLGIFAGAIWLFYKIYKVYISKRNEARSFVISKEVRLRDLLMISYRQNDYSSLIKRFLTPLPLRFGMTKDFHGLFRNDKSEKVLSQSLLKVLSLIILISFISITAVKFSQIINSESRSSFHSRLMIWNAAEKIIKDNPVFGIGPGTFQEVYLSYSKKFDKPYLEWAVTQPHNTFLAFYLQTGLIGFVGFVLILFWFFKSGLKYKNNIQYPISNILIILMIYILIHGLVDTMYWKNDLSLMFWLIISIQECSVMES